MKMEFFKFHNCDTTTNDIDWGKVIGYAYIPAFSTCILYIIINKLYKLYKFNSKSKYSFTNDYNDNDNFNSSSSFGCGMGSCGWSKGNYSCGM